MENWNNIKTTIITKFCGKYFKMDNCVVFFLSFVSCCEMAENYESCNMKNNGGI